MDCGRRQEEGTFHVPNLSGRRGFLQDKRLAISQKLCYRIVYKTKGEKEQEVNKSEDLLLEVYNFILRLNSGRSDEAEEQKGAALW